MVSSRRLPILSIISLVWIGAIGLVVLTSGVASAQTTDKCSSPVFDDVRVGNFPVTPRYGSITTDPVPDPGLDVAGSAFDTYTDKSKTKEASNFSISNDRSDSIHVRLFTKGCGYLNEFDLPPASYNTLALERGFYGVDVSVGMNHLTFGVIIECRPTCATGTIQRVGRVGETSQIVEVWRYKEFVFHVLDSRKSKPIRNEMADSQSSTPKEIEKEISKIRSGRNAPMPHAQSTAASLGGQTELLVENSTT